jgi:hypothetical protein
MLLNNTIAFTIVAVAVTVAVMARPREAMTDNYLLKKDEPQLSMEIEYTLCMCL